MNERRRLHGRQRGATGTEYVATTFAIVTALFVVPVDGAGDSVVAMLLEALRHFQQHSTYLLSLP